MPNICCNLLTIEGPQADIDHLLHRVKVDEDGGYSIFSSLLPMPVALQGTVWPSPLKWDALGQKRPIADAERERLESLKAVYGHADWCSWQRANWGMKWGDSDTTIQCRDPLSFDFWTAWNPPIVGVSAIAAMYPSLKFCLKFDEPGAGISGTVEWLDAQIAREDVEGIDPTQWPNEYLLRLFQEKGFDEDDLRRFRQAVRSPWG